MQPSIYNLSVPGLLLALALVCGVALIYIKWSIDVKPLAFATARMVLQLVAVGFVLVYLFENDSAWFMSLILTAMLGIAAWIAMRPIRRTVPGAYLRACLSLGLGGSLTLLIILFGVIRLDPWHQPRYLIPIAGMIFAGSMNAVSLAAERFYAERGRRVAYAEARNTAFSAALLPLMNNFFAVGLVTIPGMMSGQVLAGVSPLIAARYQIMVMCMLFSASGISAAVFLKLSESVSIPDNS